MGCFVKDYSWVDKTVFFLLLIGGLNWGLVGLFGWDLIAAIFGMMSFLSRIIYILIGFSAVYRFVRWARTLAK